MSAVFRDLCTVVIPAYNEASTIRDVVERTLAHATSVIVVDDGSTDGTAARLAGLPVTLLVNERNLGKAASIWRGAEAAFASGASSIVTIDGDGQHNPEDLRRIFHAAALRPNAIVIGARLHARATIPKVRYCRESLREFLDRVGGGAADRRHAVGISLLSGRGVPHARRAPRPVVVVRVRKRSVDRGVARRHRDRLRADLGQATPTPRARVTSTRSPTSRRSARCSPAGWSAPGSIFPGWSAAFAAAERPVPPPSDSVARYPRKP